MFTQVPSRLAGSVLNVFESPRPSNPSIRASDPLISPNLSASGFDHRRIIREIDQANDFGTPDSATQEFEAAGNRSARSRGHDYLHSSRDPSSSAESMYSNSTGLDMSKDEREEDMLGGAEPGYQCAREKSSKAEEELPDLVHYTAYEICMHFASVDATTGEYNVENIFSNKCYNLWLRTRKQEVMHPEQAFHRTLVTHIRGADTRKCFPEAVEKALLKALRDPSRNVWDNCFEHNVQNIGKFGFRHLGYHEQRRLEEEGELDSLVLDSAQDTITLPSGRKTKIKRKLKNALKQKVVKVTKLNDSVDVDIIEDLTRKQHKNHINEKRKRLLVSTASDSSIPHRSSIATPRTESSISFFQETSMTANFLRDSMSFTTTASLESSAKILSPWDDMLQTFQACGRGDCVSLIVSTAASFGVDLLPPALLYLMQQLPPIGDRRFAYDFIFPKESECHFYPDVDRPIGRVYVDGPAMHYTESNAALRMMLGRDPAGEFVFSEVGSLFYFWYGCSRYFNLLWSGKPQFWKRIQYKKSNGQVGLFLSRTTTRGDGFPHYHDIQEITDKFADMMRFPFFA